MPMQTRSMTNIKPFMATPEETVADAIQTRNMKRNSIFEPRPKILPKHKIIKPISSPPQPIPICGDEIFWIDKLFYWIDYSLICACLFLSFMLIYAFIFYGIEYNLTKMYPELLNSIDQIRFIYGLCWTILLTICMNYFTK